MALLLLGAAGIRAQPALTPQASEQDDAILVLLSGDVLQGKISRVDDRYLVVLPAGRIYVPVANVSIVCSTMEEAYALRRARMGPGHAQDHAELAGWCQRHGLDDAAQDELKIARQLDPDHPIVGLVERRLAASRRSHDAAENDPADTDSGDADAPEHTSAEPTIQQLEDFAAGLPEGTVEVFTRVIQPLLLNRCVTSGCHTDRSDNEFRLERSRPGMPLGRTSTYRNLLATLKLVDSADPQRSELLAPQKCPNRLSTDTTLALSRSGQYRYLVTWVHAVTRQAETQSARPAVPQNQQPADLPAPAYVPQGQPPDTIRSGSPDPSPQSPADALLGATTRAASPPNFPPGQQPSANRGPATQLPGSAEQAPASDPFDPELFNRKYGTSPPAQADATPNTPVPAPHPGFAG